MEDDSASAARVRRGKRARGPHGATAPNTLERTNQQCPSRSPRHTFPRIVANGSRSADSPGQRLDDTDEQVSWLAGRGARPAFPVSQWPKYGHALAAYSCGGSQSFQRSVGRRRDYPLFPFASRYGNRRCLEISRFEMGPQQDHPRRYVPRRTPWMDVSREYPN